MKTLFRSLHFPRVFPLPRPRRASWGGLLVAVATLGARAANGPLEHRIGSATSSDGLTWTRDPGIRLEHVSVPCAVVTNGTVYLYYVDADRGPGLPESVGCATSIDGMNFTRRPLVIQGLPTLKALDPSILIDAAGRFRLYYLASNVAGDPAADPAPHPIGLATSEDGIRFTFDSHVFERTSLVDPDVFVHNGLWWMYVFGAGRTETATSVDGRAFTYLQPLALNGWGTTAPLRLPDGRLRLYAFDQTRSSGNAVRSFTSADAVNWTPDPGDRLLAGLQEQITDPFVVPWQGGFKMYFKISDAPTNSVPGGTNAGISVSFPQRPYRGAAGGTAGFFHTGQEADLMLGGIDFNRTGGPAIYNHPASIASDGTRLLLADRNNNRVLVWRNPPGSNTPPDFVLGQPDFQQNNPGTGRHQLNWPCAVSLGTNGRLAVADTENDRLLLWSVFPASNATPASLSVPLGQFGNPAPNRPPLGWPWGVWTDGQRLVATATRAGAVLVWNSWPATSNTPPSFILTNRALGTPRTITSDGRFLAIDDHNAILNPQPAGAPAGHATFFWTNFPTAGGSPFQFVLGGRLRGGLVGSRLVLLGEARMKIWNDWPTGAAVLPAQDLAGPWGGDGVGLAVAGGVTYTVDENANAILAFRRLPTNTTGSAIPDFAMGSPSPAVNTLLTGYFLQNPCPISSGSNLFVSSDFHQRLLVWRQRPDQSGAWPDVVYELPGGGWANTIQSNRLLLCSPGLVRIWDHLPLQGELPSRTLAGRIGTNQLGQLRGIAVDQRFFYLADYDASRVMVWRGIPGSNDPAAVVFNPGGRPGRLSSDGTWLAVPVEGPPHAVKLYRVADLPAVTSPVRSIQSPQVSLNLPGGCTVARGALFIADTSNHRVLGWSRVTNAVNGLPPDLVLGASSMSEVAPAIGRDQLFMPGAVDFDGEYLWVGEFKFSSRLLRYSPDTGATGPMTLAGPLRRTPQGFEARVVGQPGQRFELQSSPDLQTWRTDAFRSMPTNATSIPVSVPLPAGNRGIYLRTRSP